MRQEAAANRLRGAAAVVLTVLLLVMINWLGARHWARADWTSSNIYSLSSKTESILAQLDEPVQAIVFMVPGSPLFEQARELLTRYEAASDMISVELIDPDKQPLRTRQLAEEFGVSVADTVVFTAGERSKYVTSSQMAEMDYSGMQMGQAPQVRAFKGEEAFTAAIVSITSETVPKVYFTTGHGELAPGAEVAAERGAIRSLTEALQRENLALEAFSLLSGTIPDDADAVAIIGPQVRFTEQETELLRDYLADGGRLLICLDPLFDRDGSMRATQLEALLAGYGIEVRNDLVVDPSQQLPFYDLSSVYLTDFTSHPVTTGLEGLAVLLPITRSVAAAAGDEGSDSDLQITPLVETSAQGWGETGLDQVLAGEPIDLDGGDASGPVSVAVAASRSDTSSDSASGSSSEDDGSGRSSDTAHGDDADTDNRASDLRLVVIGDSDFLADGHVANAGNMTLAVNAFLWLTEREAALGIPPRSMSASNLYLSAGQLAAVAWTVFIIMPGLVVIIGVVVWRRRRH